MIYSGSVNIGINPDTKPNLDSNYKWKKYIDTRSVFSIRK